MSDKEYNISSIPAFVEELEAQLEEGVIDEKEVKEEEQVVEETDEKARQRERTRRRFFF